LHKMFLKKGFVFSDGILQHLISKKKKGDFVIYKTRKIGSENINYVVQRGETFSHGETIKQAMDDLKYKISNRDCSEYKKWQMADVKTKEELIQAYRKISGACETGVKNFLSGKDLPEKMTIIEALGIVGGNYGAEIFLDFFLEGEK